MSPQSRRWLSIVWQTLLAISGATVAILLAGDQYNRFDVAERTLFLGAVTVAALGALNSLVGGIGRYREIGRSAAAIRVQKSLMALLVEISESNDVAISYLGASAFVPHWRATWRPLVRLGTWTWGDYWPTRVLVRVFRFRLADQPQPTAIAWKKGKGAVGSSWSTKRPIHRDWRQQVKEYSSPALSPAEFAAIDRALRDGFTHPEFVAIAAKYTETLAVPVLSVAGDVLGVVSIDVSARAPLTALILDKSSVQDSAEAAASLLGDDLKELYPLT